MVAMSRVAPGDLRAEDEIIVICARTVLQPRQQQRLQALASGEIDWDGLVDQALRHRVAPLLYRTLRDSCPTLPPAAVLERLRQVCAATEQRNLLLAMELVRLVRLFGAQGIAVIPFKGPLLASALYGRLGLRPFGDLDVLVHRDDASRAHRLLLAEGYRSKDKGWLPLERIFNYCREYKHATRELYAEVHWELADPSLSLPFNTPDLWGRLVQVPLSGGSVASLAPVDLLVMLCIHGSKHEWTELTFLCDVSQCIVRYPSIDYDAVRARARGLGIERPVYLSLMLAAWLLEAPVPAAVLDAAAEADPALPALAGGYLRGELFHPTTRRMSPLLYLNQGIRYLRLRERWRDRLRGAPAVAYHAANIAVRLVVLPSANDRAMVALPPRLSLLYYPLRPFLVGVRATRRLRRIVARRRGGHRRALPRPRA